ncbi:hypothetical protein B566_EDAN004434 [Ephemera danica]|nr:hypothetical protein B566_EDAN004434 [Ephemera danica]
MPWYESSFQQWFDNQLILRFCVGLVFIAVPLYSFCTHDPIIPISINHCCWWKGGEMVKESDHVKVTKVTEEKKASELFIHKALESDASNYTCVVSYTLANGSEPVPIKEEFVVVVKPSVWMPKTVTIIEGEELELNCSATGVPIPKITWIIGGNFTLNESTERILLTPDHRGVPNAILTIKETMLSDRANYVCLATNLASDLVNANATTETFVRVKDKLAALWPFLGICAEVFVLCTIILIYEKRRNKAELEESDTDQSPEQKNTPDMGKDTDVRHRK